MEPSEMNKQSQAQFPADIPLKLNQGEEIKFIEASVNFIIKNEEDEIIQYDNGTIVLTTQKVIWCSPTQKKGIFFNYQNSITHGYNKLTLVCLINFEDEEDEQPYQGFFNNNEESLNDNANEQEEEKETDSIFSKLNLMNSLMSEDDFVHIIGKYHVDFQFDPNKRSSLLDVFQIFSDCSAMNPDKNEANNNNNNANSLFGLMGLGNNLMNDEDEENGEDGENYDDQDEDEDNNDSIDKNGDSQPKDKNNRDMVFE